MINIFSEKDNCFIVTCSTDLFKAPLIDIYNNLENALNKIQLFLLKYVGYTENCLPTKEDIINHSLSDNDFHYTSDDNSIFIPFKEIYLEDLLKIQFIVINWFDDISICPTFKTFEGKNNAFRYFQNQLQEYDCEKISKYHYVDETNGYSIMLLEFNISQILKTLKERL